jgi:Acetyltransferase (GNAT) domain
MVPLNFNREPSGYAHPDYAKAVAGPESLIELPASGGWLIQRAIAHSNASDAAGPYPLFCCSNWNALQTDLDSLKSKLVSAVIVADPFGHFSVPQLRSYFDWVAPFKTHLLVDFDVPDYAPTKHHACYVAKALRHAVVEVSTPPYAMLVDWISLYDHLIQRHAIHGVQAFSPESFRRQFEIPGLVAFRATTRAGECVGAHLWFVHGDVAYSHLSAANERGYEYSCSYALYHAALEYFRGKVRCLDLGAGAGATIKADGLTKFKAGWSNSSKTAFICGRILDTAAYKMLSSRAAAGCTSYFPAYRYAEVAQRKSADRIRQTLHHPFYIPFNHLRKMRQTKNPATQIFRHRERSSRTMCKRRLGVASLAPPHSGLDPQFLQPL